MAARWKTGRGFNPNSKSLGRVVIVDKEDIPLLMCCRWSVNGTGYAKSKLGLLHRVVLDAKEGQEVDHINKIRLDCRRRNLRFVTHSENHYNTKIRTDNTSGVKGVTRKKDGKWQAQAHKQGKMIFLGVFKEFEQAVKARKDWEQGRLNGD